MYYEHLMQQIPNFDKQPREIKDIACFGCEGFNTKTGKCRFCECQFEKKASDGKPEVVL